MNGILKRGRARQNTIRRGDERSPDLPAIMIQHDPESFKLIVVVKHGIKRI